MRKLGTSRDKKVNIITDHIVLDVNFFGVESCVFLFQRLKRPLERYNFKTSLTKLLKRERICYPARDVV